MNFLYDDIVHALQNTIDSCVNAATYRHGYVLEHRFTKFSEITQCYGHYAVQGHSRSLILVPIEAHIQLPISDYNTNLGLPLILQRFQVKLIIGQIFASEKGVPHFNAVAGGDPLPMSP